MPEIPECSGAATEESNRGLRSVGSVNPRSSNPFGPGNFRCFRRVLHCDRIPRDRLDFLITFRLDNSHSRLRKLTMPHPVVHFEIGCRDNQKAQEFYSKLFDWKLEPYGPAAMIDTGIKQGINRPHQQPRA